MTNPFAVGRSTEPAPEVEEAIDAEFEDAPPRVNVISNVTLRAELRIYDEDEVAGALGQQVRTLKHWRTTRQGPPYIKVGRAIFYLFGDLSEWLRSVRVVPDNTGEGNDGAEKGLQQEQPAAGGRAASGAEHGDAGGADTGPEKPS